MATIHIFLGVSESKKNELLQGISDREREARANAGDISAERDKALAEIDARRKDSERTRDATLTENLADAEAELKDARSRFEQKSAEIAAAEPPEKIKAELEDAQASLEGFGLGTSSKPQAILDASLAAQQFGGRDDEMITELRGIRENTKPKKFVFNGLPVS